MKHEWRKHEKDLYGTKNIPTILKIYPQKYITISGKGNPNDDNFSQHVGVLMSVAYSIKMNFKKYLKNNPEKINNYPFDDYTVYPLEGLWTSSDDDVTNKDAYAYTIMVRQPDFMTRELFETALEEVKKKNASSLLSEIGFQEMNDALSVQILHKGSYDNEPESFAQMETFIKENGFIRTDKKVHREIYLSDARKVEPAQLKTLLRYRIEKID